MFRLQLPPIINKLLILLIYLFTLFSSPFAAAVPPTANLNIAKPGSGFGVVSSGDVNINCGADCSASYAPGTAVTLNTTASETVAATFSGAAIAAGLYHTVALKSDGTVWAWGFNGSGQLGDGTATQRTTPVAVSGLSNVIAIAGGSYHTVALKSDGTVWAWGWNSFGQLGDDTFTDSSRPVAVSGLNHVIAIAAGNLHTVALTSDGTVWTWGFNWYGQLGDGSTTDRSSHPVAVSGLNHVIAIAGGAGHTVALKSDGTVWAWGWNSSGQLGDDTFTDSSRPVAVSGLNHVIAIAAGYVHTVALTSEGTVWAWGSNSYGQLGDGTTTNRSRPVAISCLNHIIAIVGAYYHTAALKSGGTVWAWGSNHNGELGDGSSSTTGRSRPVAVSGLNHVIAIAGGGDHTVALKGDGTVWVWGGNGYGQLGSSTTTGRSRPGQVHGAGDVGFLNLFSANSTTSSAVGVFRNGQWFLDANGNGAWDGCDTEFCFSGFGQAGDMPASGNWDGGSKSYIGVLRSGTGEWFIDRNGNQQWDGCVGDACYSFGQIGDLPVAGDWTGSGFAQIGVFRNGQWYLDANGNGAWNECGADLCRSFGQLGDLPVVGDWNGDAKAEVGVFRAGSWYLDANSNGAWDGCGIDRCFIKVPGQSSPGLGEHGDLPIVGDWNSDGKAKVGVFRNGTWYLDYNGNGAWDGCGVDRCYEGSFGQAGDLPVAGKW